MLLFWASQCFQGKPNDAMTSMQVSSRLSGRAGRLPAFRLRAVYWREGAGEVAGVAGAGAREPGQGRGTRGRLFPEPEPGNFPPPETEFICGPRT